MSASFNKQLHTLDSFTFSYTELNKEWGCDKRYGHDAFQRFIFINRRALDFLNISTEIEVIGNTPHIKFTTSQYAGCVPLLSPLDGKPCGDLSVTGRFGEDISEVLSIVGDTLLPTYDDTLQPLSSSILEPPLYFECCNFIDKWLDVEHSRWNKFDVIEKQEHTPANGTRWEKYALNCYDVKNSLLFPNRINKLQPLHKEFRQLLSILFICFRELDKSRTPIRSRIAYIDRITRLRAKYDESQTEKVPQIFHTHTSDPIAVKEAKTIANIILKNKQSNNRAWRIDYSELFERYIQYIIEETAKINHSKLLCNPHYNVFGQRPNWALNYLEPDIVMYKDDLHFIIDAKYKSHMFNWNEGSIKLKETFRHDLHQILAYCSFNNMITKKAFLVYPFTDYTYHKLQITSPISHNNADVFLVGIPLKKDKLKATIDGLQELIKS